MKFQIINYSEELNDSSIVCSNLATPKSLDEFDVNIINLADEKTWYCGRNLESICCMEDLKNIGIMIAQAKRTKILFALPQDILIHLFSHIEVYGNGKEKRIYNGTSSLKNNLDIIVSNIYSLLYPDACPFRTYYENTVTMVGELEYNAAFYFQYTYEGLTYSACSTKPTTIKYNNSIYLTTLDIFSSEEHLKNYIEKLFYPDDKQTMPEWIDEIIFHDDNLQKNAIESNNEIIKRSMEKIKEANEILEKNRRIKSILYTTGQELVNEVLSILEYLFDYSFDDFKDKKKEDFLIKKPDYTLIGEIKGISSNVKNENISQLEVHYQQYMDILQENNKSENVYKILLINPLRDRSLRDRDPINEDKIKLAEHYGSLIVETKTLLRIFEAFLQNKITVSDCEKLFIGKTGLLEEKDIPLLGTGS